MNKIQVGDPAEFSIETGIAQAFERTSERALGYHIIHVCGVAYGVRSDDATLLGCSFDAVKRRVSQRGQHRVHFESEQDAAKIVDAVWAALYDESRQEDRFFGFTSDGLQEVLASKEIMWAPDGDAAFDDGGHVLQFDHPDGVRVIAFKNASSVDEVLASLSEVWISADKFYGILDCWLRAFELAWKEALSSQSKF